MQPDPEIDALVNKAKAELKEGNVTRAALEKVLSSYAQQLKSRPQTEHFMRTHGRTREIKFIEQPRRED